VGIDEGLKRDSAVNLDHVQTVDQGLLRRYLGSLSGAKMAAVCHALVIATGCSD
jgi:mRNA-degrading endonuclease toxin of MazEF toxin-antitoxin module